MEGAAEGFGVQHFCRRAFADNGVIDEDHLVGILGKHSKIVGGHQDGQVIGLADLVQHIHQGFHTLNIYAGQRLIQY